MAILFLMFCGDLFALTRAIHYLEGRAAAFLFNVGDDTHTDILVATENYCHKLSVNLGHCIAFCCNKISDVIRCLEGVIELDTGIGTVLGLHGLDRCTDVDV